MDAVAAFLNIVEEAFGLSEASQIATVLESIIVGLAQSKQLRKTKSWSTNCLIRLYHSHGQLKAAKKFPEFVADVKENEAVQKWFSS